MKDLQRSARQITDRWEGRTIEGFRIEKRIGEGAMGQVYRAEMLEADKRVALKLLHDHLGDNERITRRFHREARAASRLSHPHSVEIIDFGQWADGTLYIAMELLEGEDLQTVIEHDAPFTPRRIGEIMEQILDALQEAHVAGIIHRDLKPENVLVESDAADGVRVKVCDFGIAKIVETDGRSTAITKDGYVCGTPEYMAPEQARGDPLSARVDVYAAGVMLYQLLCGRLPFEAQTALGLITKHIMEPPEPPRQVQPAWGIPRSLNAIALRALAKAPEDRFVDAQAMARAIAAAILELGESADTRLGEAPFTKEAEPESPSGRGRGVGPQTAETIARSLPPAGEWRWGMALIGAVCVAAFGTWLWVDEAVAPAAVPAPEGLASAEPAPREARPSARAEAPEYVAPPAPTPPSDEPPVEDEAPDPPRARPRRSAFEQGHAHLMRGELPQAIQSLREAARQRPRSARVRRELGRAYMRAGQVEEGVAAYRRYLELAPNASDRPIIERLIAQQER